MPLLTIPPPPAFRYVHPPLTTLPTTCAARATLLLPNVVRCQHRTRRRTCHAIAIAPCYPTRYMRLRAPHTTTLLYCYRACHTHCAVIWWTFALIRSMPWILPACPTLPAGYLPHAHAPGLICYFTTLPQPTGTHTPTAHPTLPAPPPPRTPP